eukprot:1095725-Alexandrium_andersonii.AAC.1
MEKLVRGCEKILKAAGLVQQSQRVQSMVEDTTKSLVQAEDAMSAIQKMIKHKLDKDNSPLT